MNRIILQIPIIQELPQVGKNLFDHLNMPVYVNLDAPVSITLQKMQTLAEVIKYFVFETGKYNTIRLFHLPSKKA